MSDRNRKWVEEYIQNRWLNLGDTSKLSLSNPFLVERTEYEIENPHLFWLDQLRKPENFFFTAKWIFNKTLPPIQLAILRELWVRPFPMLLGSRGLGKSFLLALYAMFRALLNQGSKIVIVGAAFRQAKVVFDYCQEIWENAPLLRDLVGVDKRNGPRRDVDRCTLRMEDSLIVALPLGTGEKIRGQRANIIICDEFASVPVDIFETVVRGFAAVSMSPIEKLQHEARKQAIKELGLWKPELDETNHNGLVSNQTIISGTAYYSFNHFYEYWKRYKTVIESRGDRELLSDLFKGEVPDDFNWKDYSVIRVPVDMLPPGFMDKKQIAQAKATMHVGTYHMEYGATFPSDSNGFFKRSLVESCVVGRPGKAITLPSCGEVRFHAVLRGEQNRQYVMAVDPASERDNFSIVVLEVWPDHRRIVFCWTTTRGRFKEKAKRGLTQEQDFYRFCCRKIRDLLKAFPCSRVAIDTQGGGIAVIEALQDSSTLGHGERPIYPVVTQNDPKDTDDYAGDHILELVNFARADWVAESNHGMRKDFEDKALLFPEYDAAIVGLAIEEDKATGRVKVDQKDNAVEKLYDTLEDCVLEIEDLKDELATIVHTQTGVSMRDRWDTPEVKEAGGKRGRLRKDRYSALLMANMTARSAAKVQPKPEYQSVGGFAHQRGTCNGAGATGRMWIGPSWYADRVGSGGSYGAVVRRKV